MELFSYWLARQRPHSAKSLVVKRFKSKDCLANNLAHCLMGKLSYKVFYICLLFISFLTFPEAGFEGEIAHLRLEPAHHDPIADVINKISIAKLHNLLK